MAAAVTSTPSTQAQGLYVNLAGTEFGSGEVVRCFVGGFFADTFQTDKDGSFSARVDIPSGVADGSQELHCVDDSGVSADVTITVA